MIDKTEVRCVESAGSAGILREQKAAPIKVEAFEIKGADGLDPIQVYWRDIEPGKGFCTITCYGSAWTIYFGGMGGRTIREFFAMADTGYLLNKLGYGQTLNTRKVNLEWLERIINAVKASLAADSTPAVPR